MHTNDEETKRRKVSFFSVFGSCNGREFYIKFCWLLLLFFFLHFDIWASVLLPQIRCSARVLSIRNNRIQYVTSFFLLCAWIIWHLNFFFDISFSFFFWLLLLLFRPIRRGIGFPSTAGKRNKKKSEERKEFIRARKRGAKNRNVKSNLLLLNSQFWLKYHFNRSAKRFPEPQKYYIKNSLIWIWNGR